VDFLADYASFLAKTVTLVAAMLVVLIVIASLRRGRTKQGEGHLEVHKLNDFYKAMRERLEQSLVDKDQLKLQRKREAKAAKQAKKNPESRPRVFVLDFDGDIKASAVENLRHEITALLTLAIGQVKGSLAAGVEAERLDDAASVARFVLRPRAADQ